MTRLLWVLVAVCGCRDGKPAPKPAPKQSPETKPSDDSQLVAVEDGDGVTLAKIDRAAVTPVGSVPKTLEFWWLDAKTLVNLDLWGSDGKTITVTRIVDGKPVDPQPVTKAELGDWAAISLGVTQSGEAWIGTCDSAHRLYGPAPADPWATSDDGPCTGRHYIRVVPAPRTQQDTIPAGIVRDHKPPTVTAPPQYKLSTEEVSMEYRCDGGEGAEAWCPFTWTVSVCEENGKRTRYPEPPKNHRTEDGGLVVEAGEGRWVSDRPWLYEVPFVWCHERSVPGCARYFRPCEGKPFDGYAWLGQGRWASFVADPSTGEPTAVNGTWTVWDHDHALGTLRGHDVLRAYPR